MADPALKTLRMTPVDTPLAKEIKQLIRADGPMPVDRYTALCLTHPEHGYYMRRDPFGAEGDFITAPEVSQMFGEIVGVWCLTVWESIGRPRPFNLVELGPGRGTLMRDLLRATRKSSLFQAALAVHLVEASPELTLIQRHALSEAGCDVYWHRTLADLPRRATLILANEFFDALPTRQLVRGEQGWHERCVGTNADGRLVFVQAASALPQASAPDWACDVKPGQVIELSTKREEVARQMGGLIATHSGIALIVDYGHVRSAAGDTLQAVRRHAYVDPLESPGECDLTTHVDFQALAESFEVGGARTYGPVAQGEFLARMFIGERASSLKAGKDAGRIERIDAAVNRLTAPDQMGTLFKVLACSHPEHPVPYPFEEIVHG